MCTELTHSVFVGMPLKLRNKISQIKCKNPYWLDWPDGNLGKVRPYFYALPGRSVSISRRKILVRLEWNIQPTVTYKTCFKIQFEHQFYVFLRLAAVTFSCAWRRLLVFLRLAPATCFPALGAGRKCSALFAFSLTGKIPYLLFFFLYSLFSRTHCL